MSNCHAIAEPRIIIWSMKYTILIVISMVPIMFLLIRRTKIRKLLYLEFCYLDIVFNIHELPLRQSVTKMNISKIRLRPNVVFKTRTKRCITAHHLPWPLTSQHSFIKKGKAGIFGFVDDTANFLNSIPGNVWPNTRVRFNIITLVWAKTSDNKRSENKTNSITKH